MKTVTNGNSVKLHYKGTFPDGEVFDDSRQPGRTPMRVMVGTGNLIKGFENALIGMGEGETKTINLTSEEAYGSVQEAAIVTVPKNAFPEDFQFEEGLMVMGNSPDGREVRAKIVAFTEEEVTLDHNHPLAGKDLKFEIELLEIESSDTQEGNNEKSLSQYIVKELRQLAKDRKIRGFSTMKKAELVETLST